ncbi:MAG: elongation factor P [Chloroflexi bacterium]|nr:elongation factor P [Chloroflexota bacterium]MCL5947302.1 elongation factor P [Chloroflexota bacterium]
MIGTGDLKKGIAIELDGNLYRIEDFQHVKMGRGSAYVKLKLRNIRKGDITERTFQAGDRLIRATLDKSEVQFLYEDGDTYYFMNTETYEQVAINRDRLSEVPNFLKENMAVSLLSYGDEPISIELPPSIDLEVTYTEPGIKGDTATGATKPATLETGFVVQVPLFVNTGDRIRVDTRYGTYIERAS